MGVIDPCTQAAFQTENGSSAVEHAVQQVQQISYYGLGERWMLSSLSPFSDLFHPILVLELVQRAILGDDLRLRCV
ncbi:Protein of unknown function, partial [Gryllus bimaculatus]